MSARPSTSGRPEQHAPADCQQQKRRPAAYRELPLYNVMDPPSGECCGRIARACCRLPRTKNLCRLLALMVGLMVAFHAASCGYFFCVRFPGVMEFPRDIYDDIRDIYILAGVHEDIPPNTPELCHPCGASVVQELHAA